ncbi:DAP1 [Candida jiufengensis]|uniref:DAP1 n=1 Tax=Candida jiufengensis TaxID=497108 RepID=UPI002224CF45|nr:DAP1 [Candida jiufengensis]KAI5954318.1 DAP1 [Candida jiufengensis]
MITEIIIFLIIIYFAKTIYTEFLASGNPFSSSNQQEESIIEGKFTPKTLYKYNGKDHPKIFMAVKSRVYDVSQGSQFYGPGGPYENFAGRDASRGLALNSFDPAVLTPLDEPIDDLKDLKELEKESLESWDEHFENRYKIVGTLHENGTVNEEIKGL